MKKLKYLFCLGVLLLFMNSCATNSIRLRVMKPAMIDVPKEIKTLGLANRYKPKKGNGNRVLNVLEGIISGEGIGTDRRGAEASLEGLATILRESPRFQSTQLPVELEGSGRAVFPPPLDVAEVKRLCEIANADALVTIEAFDSDSRMNYGTRNRKEKVNGDTRDVTYQTVDADLKVTAGWRMYDANSGMIVDEYRMVEHIHFREEGRTRDDALNRLPDKRRMTQRVGQVLGDAYARRISPAWLWVRRDYFSRAKKTPEMKVARNSVRVENWEEAARIWKTLTSNPNPKVSRRAMFNLALAAEVRGDIESAIHWSEQSYKLGLNKALSYNQILRNRKFELERLENQLKEEEE